jgi:CO dehydrogenase/acetyl-CoA synthase delta subunit
MTTKRILAKRTTARRLRRAPWERGTAALIGVGLVMLMQPWSIEVYSYAFTVLLAGVIGYSIAGKLPQGD